MSLTLILEHAPHPQSKNEFRHENGDLIIGRGDDAHWRINDPDMFVSRKHGLITGSDGQFTVTDSSTGGLYVDGADNPLGAGQSATLEDGMRIRMGDYVFVVKLRRAAAPNSEPDASDSPPPTAPPVNDFDNNVFFKAPEPAQEPPERPKSLPEPFESKGFFDDPAAKKQAKTPLPAFDDPFTLDPLSEPRVQAPVKQPARDETRFDFKFGEPAPTRPARQPALKTEEVTEITETPEVTKPPLAPTLPEKPTPSHPSDEALRSAFFKGLGVDIQDFSTEDPERQMQELGKRYRNMVEGMISLLRMRARIKRDAHIAQTVIGKSDVNPLKFLPSTTEAVSALVEARGPGYLDPDQALADGFRDLADHHMKSWRGVQAALRQMVDRFDPEQLELELADESRLGTLLMGGRRAKLWELYQEKYKQIARSAETRFLGEAGADFADAYESKGGHDDD